MTDLRLSGNRFECSCKIAIGLKELNQRSFVHDYHLIKLSPCWTTNKTETQMDVEQVLHEYCTSDFIQETFYGLILLGILTFLLLGLLIIICISEKARVLLYNNSYFSVCFRQDPEHYDSSMRYDAFISYSEEDSEYAEQLVASMENASHELNSKFGGRTYRCCTHQRDWKAGDTIHGNIIRSVETSHRTIILMSSHYLTSTWCQREFDEAFQKNKLIVIMLESGKEANLEANPTIRSYVKTYTYLTHNDPDLWKKLAYRLPHKPMPRSKRKNRFYIACRSRNPEQATSLKTRENGSREVTNALIQDQELSQI